MINDAKVPVLNPGIAGGEPQHRVRSWPAAPWVETELQGYAATELAPGSVVAEIGIGAGSYARGLLAPAVIRLTVDLPVQQASQPWQWPVASGSVDLLLSIDALHYESDIADFVKEAARVLKPGKPLVLLARSREDLQADGLARFFPTAVERALPLLTEIPVLEQLFQNEGLPCERSGSLKGNLQIDETLLRAIAHRELTGLGALSDDEFNTGVERLKTAVGSGNTAWPAHFTVLVCRKAATS